MHLIGVICAGAVPLLMLLPYLGSGSTSEAAWKLKRLDIVVLIFCVLAAGLLLVSLVNQSRSLCLAAAALLFAAFGLVLAFPLEFPALTNASVKIGGYLSPLVALVGGGAAVFAAEQVPVGAGPAPVGAGRGADPAFTAPLAGAAPGSSGPAAGWYPDPHGQAKLRYYDGRDWTQQTSN
jgi:hypothetical protein